MDSTGPITLDYTLRDLYSDNNGDLSTVLVYDPVHFGYTGGISSTKFTYGYKLRDDGDENAALSTAMAAKMVAQRYAFSAGQMPVVILDSDSKDQRKDAKNEMDTLSPYYADTLRTFAQLAPNQQPTLKFARSPESISLDAGAHIAVLLPTDCLAHLPHLIEPELHYEILSKRGLALSGLPTPPSQVVDTCLTEPTKPILLKQEITRIVHFISQRQLPFMVKLAQSVSGMGTFAITTEAERDRVKNIITAGLGTALQQLNKSNYYLYPCSLLLQDLVTGPVVALSLFITKSGQPQFIACCKQLFNKQGHWIGGSISYQQQEGLRQAFTAIMNKVAAFLHSKAYHGPAGVDIITDEQSGEQLIIDLNVRATGTFHLGPLLGHFTKRGLFEASMTMGDCSCSRDVFEAKFADEIRNGSLIVSGWVHGESSSLSHAAFTFGAKDSSALEKYRERINAVCLQA